MRKGRRGVKRLAAVWLSAALAMGAPGSSLVSVASEVESVTQENGVTDSDDKSQISVDDEAIEQSSDKIVKDEVIEESPDKVAEDEA